MEKKIIDMGDGKFVEFPSSMSDEEINHHLLGTTTSTTSTGHPQGTGLQGKGRFLEDAKNTIRDIGETASHGVTGAQSAISYADPVLAAGGALASYALPTSRGSFRERFANEQEHLNRMREEAFTKSPVVASGSAMGAMMSGAAPVPMYLSRAAQASTPIARGLAGIGDMMAFSGASEAGPRVATGDNPVGAFAEGASHPMNVLGAAHVVVPEAVFRARQGYYAGKKRFADYIAGEGKVPQLLRGLPWTTGQRAGPTAFVNRVEEAGQSLPGGGAIIDTRTRGHEAARERALERGVAPGAVPSRAGDTKARLEENYKTFDAAYEPVKGVPVAPSILPPTPGMAGQPSQARPLVHEAARIAMTESEPRVVDTFQKFAAQKLLGAGIPLKGAVPKIPSDNLLALRSEIRYEIRTYSGGAPDPVKTKMVNLLEQFEDSVTMALRSQLPPAQMNHLEQVDKAYHNYKILEAAQASMAGDTPFTARALDTAARKPMGQRQRAHPTPNYLKNYAAQWMKMSDRVPDTGGSRRLILSPIIEGTAAVTGGLMGGLTGGSSAAVGGAMAGLGIPYMAARGIHRLATLPQRLTPPLRPPGGLHPGSQAGYMGLWLTPEIAEVLRELRRPSHGFRLQTATGVEDENPD